MLLYILGLACFFSFFLGVGVGKKHRPRRLRVEVGQSRDDYGWPVKHTISARIMKADDNCLHYERVDMREEDWEEQLAVATAKMKQKVRALEAAQQIAGTRE